MTKTKVLITGASGLLGRAFMRVFTQNLDQFEIIGLAFSRYDKYVKEFPQLLKLDLTDPNELSLLVQSFKPNIIIHSAAERRPDICENDKEATLKLNVGTTETICKLANDVGSRVLVISSDYVFDGKNAPYQVDSPTNPISFYGETKKASEDVCLKNVNQKNIVLRVPVLYGQVESLKECSVSMVAQQVVDALANNKSFEIDNWQQRYPTLVDDVARVVVQIIKADENGGIYHFSGDEQFTKYGMAVEMLRFFTNGDMSKQNLLIPADAVPTGAARPFDCKLSTTKTVQFIQEKLGQQVCFSPFIPELIKSLQPFK
ncbi:hypothetical protein CYY_010392 [Polysphondylium violaceum]|uniref:RmlD-like substrate binding domain-containing protein n=1 Tax=Polysphondylium violaceum TaxID=133409 RepID=A0A8J4UZT5_9MYCE|nr:hypothetical protein CYY_010392 [Polysphondylium violaceum]